MCCAAVVHGDNGGADAPGISKLSNNNGVLNNNNVLWSSNGGADGGGEPVSGEAAKGELKEEFRTVEDNIRGDPLRLFDSSAGAGRDVLCCILTHSAGPLMVTLSNVGSSCSCKFFKSNFLFIGLISSSSINRHVIRIGFCLFLSFSSSMAELSLDRRARRTRRCRRRRERKEIIKREIKNQRQIREEKRSRKYVGNNW